MSNQGIDLTWDASEFIASCVKFRAKFEASVLILCQIAAMKMEEYAKNEAPWTDRTGNARQFLKGQADWISNDKIMIAVSHRDTYNQMVASDSIKKALMIGVTGEWQNFMILPTQAEQFVTAQTGLQIAVYSKQIAKLADADKLPTPDNVALS